MQKLFLKLFYHNNLKTTYKQAFCLQEPELEARLERLRAIQANREYASITKNVDLRVSSINNNYIEEN